MKAEGCSDGDEICRTGSPIMNTVKHRAMRSLSSAGAAVKSVWTGTSCQDKVSMAVIVSVVLFWTALILDRGGCLSSYVFLYDSHFWGSDYYGPLYMLKYGIDPWEGGINYPAGAYVFYRIAYHMIPLGSSAEFSDALMGRTYSYATLGLILTYFLSFIPLWFMLRKMGSGSNMQKSLFALSIILCGPMFAAIVFGNIFLICLAPLFLFLTFYQSEKRWLRWISYAALGISASIKVYPAVFAIMILTKKYKKEFIPACALVAVMFLLPFFWFEGLSSLKAFLGNFVSDSAWKADWGMGYVVSFQNLVKLASTASGSYWNGEIPFWMKLIPFAVFFLIFLSSKEDWKKVFACALLCVWFPTMSWTYMLVLFVPPICMLARSIDEAPASSTNLRFKAVCVALLTATIIPYATPLIDSVNTYFYELKSSVDNMVTVYPLSWGIVIIHTAIVLLILLILIDNSKKALMQFKCKDKSSGKHARSLEEQ